MRLADTDDNAVVSTWAEETAGTLAGRLRACGVACSVDALAPMLDRRAATLGAAMGWSEEQARAYVATDGLDDIVSVMTAR